MSRDSQAYSSPESCTMTEDGTEIRSYHHCISTMNEAIEQSRFPDIGTSYQSDLSDHPSSNEQIERGGNNGESIFKGCDRSRLKTRDPSLEGRSDSSSRFQPREEHECHPVLSCLVVQTMFCQARPAAASLRVWRGGGSLVSLLSTTTKTDLLK